MKSFNRFQEDIEKRREQIAATSDKKRAMEVQNRGNINQQTKLKQMSNKLKDEVKDEIYKELGVK
jgi:hypothetical protein